MPDRVVKVTLVAQVSSYLASMDRVTAQARVNQAEADKLSAKLQRQQQMFTSTGRAMLVAGGLVAAGLALAVSKAAEFDAQMSAVQAATHASAKEMSELREAAIKTSQGTKFSATEAASAIEELSKAGVGTKEIIGGALKGALDLAAAGAMDVATAAGVAATTLGQFQLKGEKTAHVADVLAAGAGKAMGDVSDLSQALAQSGTVAAQFGISLDDTVGSLSAFASKGLLGSDAGTSLRTMLLRLANPTGQAAAEMKKLGIQAYDAQGNFVGLAGLAGQLQQGMKGLSQEQRNAALAVIFGQDAIRAANVLYVEGAKGIQDWTEKVNDTGYASETASKRLDNLKGDLTKLKTAFDNLLIGVGDSGQGPLRAAAQSLTGILDGFNKLPAPAKDVAFWVAAAGSAIAVAGGIALLAVPKVAALKIALIELGAQPAKVTAGFGAMGTAMKAVPYVALTLGLNEVINQLADGALQATGFMKSVDQLNASFSKVGIKKTVDEALGAFGDSQIEAKTSFGFFSDLNNQSQELMRSWRLLSPGMNQLQDAIDPTRMGLEQLDKTLAGMVKSGNTAEAADTFKYLATKTDGSKDSIAKLKSLLPEYSKSLKDTKDSASGVAGATGEAADAATTAADAFQEEQDRVKGVTDAYLNLMKQINDSNDVNQKAISANAAWREGLASITDQVKKNGKTLDESTAKGAENADMLASLAGKAQDAAAAQFEVDKKTMSAEDATKKYSSTLAAQKTAFEKAAIAAGFNADQVKKLADRVFGLPSKTEIQILINKSQAEAQLANLTKARTMFIKVRYDQATDSIQLGGGRKTAGHARGGYITGPGTGTSDSILARLSNGEFVNTAAATAVPSNRRAMEYMNAGGVIPGFAQGGFVRPQYAQPTFTFPVAGGSRTVTVNQDIHPTTGMSEADVGRLAAEKTAFVLRLGE